jgi:hypothetical protein
MDSSIHIMDARGGGERTKTASPHAPGTGLFRMQSSKYGLGEGDSVTNTSLTQREAPKSATSGTNSHKFRGTTAPTYGVGGVDGSGGRGYGVGGV